MNESCRISLIHTFVQNPTDSYRASPNTRLPNTRFLCGRWNFHPLVFNTRSHNTRLLCGCRIFRPLVFNTRFQKYTVFLPPSCFSFAPPGGGARRHSTVLKTYSVDFIEGAGGRRLEHYLWIFHPLDFNTRFQEYKVSVSALVFPLPCL